MQAWGGTSRAAMGSSDCPSPCSNQAVVHKDATGG